MAAYKHIFFDLDQTLWDFDKNCAETLKELYVSFALAEKFDFTVEEFIEKYMFVNAWMWKDYSKGKISKDDIREKRFVYTFLELGLKNEDVPKNINDEFLKICPSKGHLIPFTAEVLHYLGEKYSLHIITNGFKDTQHIKLSTSNIDKFFNQVINSEVCGFLKPDKKIFDHALERINASSGDCIMIGDDLEADVLGAKNAGIDHVYFNRWKLSHAHDLQHEITCLSELKGIL